MIIKSTQWKLKSVGKKKENTIISYWFGHKSYPVPKQHAILEISFNLVKSFTSQRSTKGCTLPCSLWKTKWMYPSLELIHKRCTLSCSQYNNPQVGVPSTCTPKDVPSNVLGQRIPRRLVLLIFLRGNKRYLRWLVLWNLLLKGKGRIKRILKRLLLWILLEERRETQKNLGS